MSEKRNEPETILVSVIIPNWNGREHLFTCLTSLETQSFSNVEVILVDNGSTDGSVEYVETNFPKVRIIKNPKNLGFAGGCNRGIENAQGIYIALINNDTEADEDWLRQSIGALEKYPEAGFTASRIRLFDLRSHLDTAGDLYFRSGFPGKRGAFSEDGPEFDQYEWVFGACAGAAVYRKTLFDEIGLFDEDFFSFMEDVDLSFRAQLAGFRCLYVPTAIVFHKLGATAGLNDPRRLKWSHRNRWYTLIKNLPTRLWIRNIGRIFIADAAVFGSAILQLRAGIYFQSRFEALRNLRPMIKKRHQIQKHRNVSTDYINSVLSDGWLSHRVREKKKIKEIELSQKQHINST